MHPPLSLCHSWCCLCAAMQPSAQLEYSHPGDIRHILNFISLWEWVAMIVNVYFPRTRPPNSTFIIHPAAPSSPTWPYLLLLLGLSPWTCTLEMMVKPKRVGPPHPTSAQLWLSPAWCSYCLDLCIQTATSAAAGRATGTLSLARRPLSQLFHASQLRQNLAVPPLPALYTMLSLPSAANSPWDTISFPP